LRRSQPTRRLTSRQAGAVYGFDVVHRRLVALLR
jgi:hypothetical protein